LQSTVRSTTRVLILFGRDPKLSADVRKKAGFVGNSIAPSVMEAVKKGGEEDCRGLELPLQAVLFKGMNEVDQKPKKVGPQQN
jgi:hypothetical protein